MVDLLTMKVSIWYLVLAVFYSIVLIVYVERKRRPRPGFHTFTGPHEIMASCDRCGEKGLFRWEDHGGELGTNVEFQIFIRTHWCALWPELRHRFR